MFLSFRDREPFSAAKTDTFPMALSEFLALLWGEAFNKRWAACHADWLELCGVSGGSCLLLSVYTCMNIGSAALCCCKWRFARKHGLHKSHLRRKHFPVQCYPGSPVGNSDSGLALGHVLVMRDGGPFPPTSPLTRERGRFAQRQLRADCQRFLRRGTSPQGSLTQPRECLLKVWYTQTLCSEETPWKPHLPPLTPELPPSVPSANKPTCFCLQPGRWSRSVGHSTSSEAEMTENPWVIPKWDTHTINQIAETFCFFFKFYSWG